MASKDSETPYGFREKNGILVPTSDHFVPYDRSLTISGTVYLIDYDNKGNPFFFAVEGKLGTNTGRKFYSNPNYHGDLLLTDDNIYLWGKNKIDRVPHVGSEVVLQRYSTRPPNKGKHERANIWIAKTDFDQFAESAKRILTERLEMSVGSQS